MTDLGDRVLVTVIAATMFGTVVMWWGGLVEAETGGVLELVFGGLLLVVLLASLYLVWSSAKRAE